MDKLLPVLHGLQHTPEYHTWNSMRMRCLNPNSRSYKDYGGRGIAVCERWNLFANFYTDMGKRPSLKHSINRIDNDGNYEPDNCEWASIEQQHNNRRDNHLITYKGKTKTITQWSKYLNISVPALRTRIVKYKWSVDKAFNTPLKLYKKKSFIHNYKENST